MSKHERGDLGFDFLVAKDGEVEIQYNGKTVSTLKGGRASKFVKKMESVKFLEQQQMMASMTRANKHANERPSKNSAEKYID